MNTLLDPIFCLLGALNVILTAIAAYWISGKVLAILKTGVGLAVAMWLSFAVFAGLFAVASALNGAIHETPGAIGVAQIVFLAMGHALAYAVRRWRAEKVVAQ